jgi:hypothetical protein
MIQGNTAPAAHHLSAAFKAVRRRRYAEAAVLLERAFALAPPDSAAPLVLASIASLHVSRFQASGEYLERALRLEPGFAPAHGMRLFTRLKSSSGTEDAVMACVEAETVDRCPRNAGC